MSPRFSSLGNMLHTMRLRCRVFKFMCARFRRFLRGPVAAGFVGVAFAILVTITLMILLLNVDVTGVDGLLADTPLSVAGVRDVYR